MELADTNHVSELNRILSSLKIRATCQDYRDCRNIRLFDVRLNDGGRVREIERSAQEIALALRAKAPLIVRPILNEGVVRIQMVTSDPEPIPFADRVSTAVPPSNMTLPFYLGESVDEGPLWLDMHTAPHLLIAGTSGSGKSTLLHTIIGNVLRLPYVTLHLIDTKNVEFSKYDDIYGDISIDTTYESALARFRDLYEQMNETYLMMSLENLPANYFSLPECKYSFTVVVVDEFADLIMQDENKELHNLICKIAQKGRQAGIHLILATQRPSVDIISGAIKANFPARIACRVASRVDSNVILDGPQAQGLLGKGDALIRTATHDLVRFQSAFASPEENVRALIEG